MRRTNKYVHALEKAREVAQDDNAYTNMATWTQEDLYAMLEAQGLVWESATSTWTDHPKSASIFETDDGLPTGEFRLRVMGHPDELDIILKHVLDGLRYAGCAVTDISECFKNHKGPGYRVYLTCQLKERST